MDINRGCNFCCETDWSFCSKEAVRLKWRLSVYWSTLISLFCFEPLVPDCVSFFFKSFVRCRYLVSSVFLRVEKYFFKVSLWRFFKLMVFRKVIFDVKKIRRENESNSSKDFNFELQFGLCLGKVFCLSATLISTLCDINWDITVILIVKQTKNSERSELWN